MVLLKKISIIAEKFHCESLGGVTKAVKEIRMRIESEKKLAKMIQTIYGMVLQSCIK